MKISTKKDWEGYLAEIIWKKDMYAFWYTQKEAIQELGNVVDMIGEIQDDVKYTKNYGKRYQTAKEFIKDLEK